MPAAIVTRHKAVSRRRESRERRDGALVHRVKVGGAGNGYEREIPDRRRSNEMFMMATAAAPVPQGDKPLVRHW